jgi:hypothetical protein
MGVNARLRRWTTLYWQAACWTWACCSCVGDTDGGRGDSQTAWYAENVGLVKSTFSTDEMVVDTMELLSYQP